MPRFAPLLLLPLLLAACALPVRDGMVLRAPQESPTAKTAQEGPGALERVAGQETQNGAFLMGENQAAAIVEPTLDANATVAASLVALKAAQDETARLQSQLADQKAQAVALQLEIEKSKEQTARYVLAQDNTALEIEREKTKQLEAQARILAEQNKALELRVLELQAQAAVADARTRGLVALFVIVAACVAGIWFTPRMRLPRQVAAVEAEPQERDEFPELQKLNRPIIPVSDTTLDTDTNPPGNIDKFRAYVDYALQGWALGQNSVVKAKIYGSHPEYKEVLTWMRKKRYTSEQNGQIGLSDKGKRDLKLWSYDFTPPTG